MDQTSRASVDLDTLTGQRAASPKIVDAIGQNLLSKRQKEIVDLVAAAGNWRRWAFDYRYPSEDPPAEPDDDELRRALAVIDALAAQLRAARPVD